MLRNDSLLSWGDHSIAVRDWGGEGPDLVLLPGGGRNLTDWEPVVGFLLGSFRVVGVDLPGHGLSSEPEAWDWDVAVGFVEQVVDGLGLVNPWVAGHSLGGMVAARYGLAHPDAPGVVNVDGHGLGGPSVPASFHEERARLMAGMGEPPPDRGDEAWLAAQLEMMRPAVAALGLDWDAAEPAIRRGYESVNGEWRRKPSNAFITSLPDIGPDLFEVYRSVKCPLLIFNCTRKAAPPLSEEAHAAYRASLAADLQSVSADCPNVSIATFDNGHMVILEAPEAVAMTLAGFGAG